MSNSPTVSKPKLHWPTFWMIFVVAGIFIPAYRHNTIHEVVTTTGKMLFSILSTPFILEGTAIVFFIFLISMLNRWRQHRHASDWVCMPITEESDEIDPQAVKSGVERMKQSLESGQHEEALRELKALASFPSDSENLLLASEVLAKSYKLDEAADVMNMHRKAFPSEKEESDRWQLQEKVAMWLLSQNTEQATDLIPRWNQLWVIFTNSPKA